MNARREDERKALSRACADYRLLRAQASAAGLADLALVAVRKETRDHGFDCAAYNDIVKEIGGTTEQSGWCRFRSELGWTGGAMPAFADAGPPLFAEWTGGEAKSSRLRVQADGSAPFLRVWTYFERSLGESEPLKEGEQAFLRESAEVVAHVALRPKTRLLYHVFWGAEPHDDVHALRRRFDRFVGFKVSRKV